MQHAACVRHHRIACDLSPPLPLPSSLCAIRRLRAHRQRHGAYAADAAAAAAAAAAPGRDWPADALAAASGSAHHAGSGADRPLIKEALSASPGLAAAGSDPRSGGRPAAFGARHCALLPPPRPRPRPPRPAQDPATHPASPRAPPASRTRSSGRHPPLSLTAAACSTRQRLRATPWAAAC